MVSMNTREFTSLYAAAIAVAGLCTTTQVFGDIVYDNTTGNLHFMHVSSTEYGDEIKLAPGARQATEFQFTYYSNYDLNNGATVRFYKNNGPLVSGAAAPGDLLYQSAAFNIVKSDATDPNNVLAQTATINLSGTGLVLPDVLTWTVEFDGVGNGQDASLLVFDPPSAGSSFNDFWKKDGTTWTINQFPGGPRANFNAKLSASRTTSVPDAGSSMALMGLGLTAVVMVRRVVRR
jgi:hypothetical protein